MAAKVTVPTAARQNSDNSTAVEELLANDIADWIAVCFCLMHISCEGGMMQADNSELAKELKMSENQEVEQFVGDDPQPAAKALLGPVVELGQPLHE